MSNYPCCTDEKIYRSQQNEHPAATTLLWSPNSLRDFHDSLLAWFEQAQREFPWRSRTNPYAILVAEKLLQQTAARDAVVQAYERILSRYPAPHHLARAHMADIENIVRPLGFAYRAKELHDLAQALVARHGGEVPSSLMDLLALPGVGDYIARAVLSFAFNRDVPIVDTNISRFLYRLYGIQGTQPANPARKKILIELAAALVPQGRSKEYNLAVLDLCAEVCKPVKPLCLDCPIQKYCTYATKKSA